DARRPGGDRRLRGVHARQPGGRAELRRQRARLGAAGRERCEDRFDCEKMVAQLESVYARAVSAARR
ncbi:MAG TPA: hypothetical protein PKU91_06740, partial [Phycisphaerales bacterium]|nr:hypothetical protein [Phycisphaerales bacterium]